MMDLILIAVAFALCLVAWGLFNIASLLQLNMTALETLNKSVTDLNASTADLTTAADTIITEFNKPHPTDGEIVAAATAVDAATGAVNGVAARLRSAVVAPA